jgi:hypothetical protein
MEAEYEEEARIEVRADELAEEMSARALAQTRIAAQHLRLPPTQDDTVEALLAREFPDEPYAITACVKRDQSVGFAAAFKTGKTSTSVDCGRCLADGEPFLGLYDTALEGKVGYINAEMTERDYRDYLAPLGIVHPERMCAWHLRGYSLNLLSDAGAESAVEWLRRNEVGFWFVDPWSSLCAWAGVNENSNDEVGRLLVRLDQVKVEAGVRELVVCAHCGRADFEPGSEHARGAAKFDDWADVRWILTKDLVNNRFFSASGRGIEIEESRLTRDERGRLTIVGGSRASTSAQDRVDEVVAIVAANPGINVSGIRAMMTTTRNSGERGSAIELAKSEPFGARIYSVRRGTASLHYATDAGPGRES